jgi:predicted transcriptional regulator
MEQLEKVAEYHLKGWTASQIARELGLSVVAVKRYIEEYKEAIRNRVDQDPNFLEKLAENTLEVLDSMKMIEKEIWETYNWATENEVISQRIAALREARAATESRAKLLQLMGVKTDSSVYAKLRRAERVNEIVSGVIKEIVAHCDRCKYEAQIRLAEAFAVLERESEMVQLKPLALESHNDDNGDIIDVEEE